MSMSMPINRRSRAIATTSWLAIGAAMAFTGSAAAQAPSTAPAVVPPSSAPATSSTGQASPTGTDTIAEVVVVGARASQQSANDRKRRAKTPTDSIVADDIGSFPDRNVNEAISRIAGVALSRNDFGEGEAVSIRGNGPDLTRVELDGMGVQSTYGLSLGIDNGRSADMRELSADLIKSVDVVKGSTADMTEGGLGGSILIKTRTGLDFRKPYLSLRVGAEQNSLGKKWTPDFNLVASRKFLDDRLGVVLNLSYRNVQTTSHYQETTTSGSRSYSRLFDWDNSPDKTFQFNPDTVSGPNINERLNNNTTETPFTLVSKSAAAQTKVDCLNTFPYLATGSDAVKQQRINEQETCLNQWSDYTPSLLRQFMNSQESELKSGDIRFDYRVSDNLTVFAKFNRSDRITDDQNRQRNMNGVNFQINPNGRWQAAPPADGNPASFTNPYQRTLNENSYIPSLGEPGAEQNFFEWTRSTLYPNRAPSASNPMLGDPTLLATSNNPGGSTVTSTLTTTQVAQAAPIRGIVVNVDPASVVMDANHNVLEYDLYNTSVTIDQIDNYQPSETSYAQVGANYFGERLRVDFMAGLTKSSSSRVDWRTQRSFNYGAAHVVRQDTGLYDTIPLDPNYDETDPANYAQVIAPINGSGAQNPNSSDPLRPRREALDADQLPETGSNFTVRQRSALGESQETTWQIDFTYDTTDMIPFFTQFKTGFKYREQDTARWGRGGKQVRESVNGDFSAYETASTSDPVGTKRSSNTGFQNDLFDDVQQNYEANLAAGWRPAIIVPNADIDGSFRACVETAGSAQIDDGLQGTPTPAHPDADPDTKGLCNYGYVPNTNYNSVRSGVDTLTPAEMTALITATLENNGMIPFDGFPGSGRREGWQGIQTGNLYRMLGAGPNLGLDCVVRCMANDGNVYDQPVQRGVDEIMNLYYMADFEQENLPFGMTFNGNVGLRGVRSKTTGTAQMTLNVERIVTPADPINNVAAVLDTVTFRENVSLTDVQTDWLPSYNLNLWVVPDQLVLRYYTAKTVSRPPISRLLPGGTCTISEDVDEADDTGNNTCGGAIGNPKLRPFTSTNRNISLEWYPNRDTSFGLTWQKQAVKSGSIITETTTGPLFNNTGQVDPLTGEDISNLLFDYTTYKNGPGFERTGWEFTAKTAFTFLPWLFRYTGADYNTSTLSSAAQLLPTLDPVTGDVMKPVNESDYFDNISIWYDDGRTNARISYQGRGEQFRCIAPCGGNDNNNRNPPGTNLSSNTVPYNPGSPIFIDETKFIDAKISHNLTPNLQIFLEGRNLTKEGQTTSLGKYEPFEDGTPKVVRLNYAGRRIATGFTFKFQ